MNCKSVQELLPLYVSRDLEEKRMRQVAAHMQSCAACGASAAEYHETRQLLQEFAPPAFSEDFYSGIRQSVWREIERADTKAAPLAGLLDGLFRPRLGWAFASVLLLVLGLSAVYFIAYRQKNTPQVASLPGEVLPVKPGPVASSSPNPGSKGDESTTAATDPKQRRQVTKRLAPRAERVHTLVLNKRPQSSPGTEAALQSNKLTEPNAVQSSGTVFRMEMQTKDPNIRIIWLTPQRTKESPGKISKGV